MKILHKTNHLTLHRNTRSSGRVFYRVHLHRYPYYPESFMIDWDAVNQFIGSSAPRGTARGGRVFSNRADAENFMLAWEMSV